MPSITIRFQWADEYASGRRRTLDELSRHLQGVAIAAFTEDGEDLMGYDGALIDERTVDATIDDGQGITPADRERAALDDDHDARAFARAMVDDL